MWYEYLSVRVPLSNTKNAAKPNTSVGHALLNARYYDSQRGQFLSEDPVFIGIGNPQQVKQLTGQDQFSYLSHPQQLNAYSYGKGNPILNKDQNGLWALKIGGEYTIPGWGLTGGGGVYIDQNGIDYYVGTGLAAGGGGSATIQVTTADLPHMYWISTSVYMTGGYPVGGEVAKGITYYPYSLRKPEPYSEGGIGIAAELAAGGTSEISGPLWVWNQTKTVNYSLPKPQMVNNIVASKNSPTTSNGVRPGSGGVSPSYSQALGNLQSALQQLNTALSNYKKSTN
jgi:RHS repeat-associated protein